MVSSQLSETMRSNDELRRLFAHALPRIQRHARIYFRDIKCWHRKQDCIGEACALAWKWFCHLFQQGKDPMTFISALASFAARHVRAGRGLCGKVDAKDVLSPDAQRTHGFLVCKLPDYSTLTENPMAEALTDNTQTEIPEQVSFRLDFPAWLGTHSPRNQDIIGEMMLSRRTSELARHFGLSAGRISQMRQEFKDEWDLFTA